MTADRQEALEVEIAQTKARIRLQEARRAKEAEEREKNVGQTLELQWVETPSKFLRTGRLSATHTKLGLNLKKVNFGLIAHRHTISYQVSLFSGVILFWWSGSTEPWG